MEQINLSITTHCNRQCPLCCVRSGPPEHYTWEYFAQAAKYLHGIPVLHLTGGEPTAHPEFEALAYRLPELFGCERMTLWTNGHGWPKYHQAFGQFYRIHVSHYTPETYPGCEDNSEVAMAMKLAMGDRVRIEPNLVHVPMRRTGRKKKCGRYRRDVVTYHGGLVWPCCIGPGPMGAKGISLSENWQAELKQMAPPCDTCGFAI